MQIKSCKSKLLQKKGISEINSMLMLLNLTLIGWDQDKDLFPMTKFDSNF